MSIEFKKNILLTGAGFTVNFGGFLIREMWSKIFNHSDMESIPEIKKLLQSNFDFEDVYSQVINNKELPNEDVEKFQNIIYECYKDMDSMIEQYTPRRGDPYGVNFYGVRNLLTKFVGTTHEIGAHFTLNQDLFMERKLNRLPVGVDARNYSKIRSGVIDPIQLPSQNSIKEFKEKHLPSAGNHIYIKLHGSYGWISSDGKSQMVLGTNKFQDIQKEPLLKWYFQLFEEAIYRDKVKIIIIGYGFRDKHINNCLLKAIREHGLKIYIISPEDPEDLKNRLEGRPSQEGIAWDQKETKEIWEAVHGHFPYKLKEIFPSDQSPTHILSDIQKILK